MSETSDWNDSTEKKNCSPSCKHVCGIWYEREFMFWENLTGGISMSVFGIATSSCEILYNMTRCASDLRSARLCQFRCPNILLTLEVLDSS